jgi:hypothetical protein
MPDYAREVDCTDIYTLLDLTAPDYTNTAFTKGFVVFFANGAPSPVAAPPATGRCGRLHGRTTISANSARFHLRLNSNTNPWSRSGGADYCASTRVCAS